MKSNSTCAILIRPDLTVELVDLTCDGKAAFGSLLRLIDARCLDVVRIAPGIDMWVDDEFLHNQTERNYTAELITDNHRTLIIKGSVVLTATNRRGDTIGLSPDQTQKWHLAAVTAASDIRRALAHARTHNRRSA